MRRGLSIVPGPMIVMALAIAAQVELAEIPFIRVRGRLSARELAQAVTGPDPFSHRAQIAVHRTGIEARASLTIRSAAFVEIGRMAWRQVNSGPPTRLLRLRQW
jgi:hypothetical protein